MAYTYKYSVGTGNTLNSATSLDQTRRMFNFSERLAELAPAMSPLFVYLNKVAKKPTDDPVFKMMEQRHQWQRRNFEMYAAITPGEEVYGTAIDAGSDFYLCCHYDKYGRTVTTDQPCPFILPGQVIAIKNDDGDIVRLQISASAVLTNYAGATFSDPGADDVYHFTDTDDQTGYTFISGEMLTPVGGTAAAIAITSTDVFSDGNKGQVLGSAWAEGSTAPEGWEDRLYDREAYCQIFKTSINLFSGTSLATKYRGISNEYKRVWQEKLMEHKMDMEQSFLFNIGQAAASETSGTPTRYSWGIVPYTEAYGKQYNFTYGSSGYDAFLDAMEDFFAPEGGNSGSKLVLASRKVITYLNKLGSGGFLDNTIGASQYKLDVKSIPGNFGHTLTKVSTIFGDLFFAPEPLFRGPWEDYAVAIDLKNIAYRPLVGNGVNRDTHIITNVQDNDIDGRKDLILTEAGLEVSLPETHAILKFS